VSTDPYGVHYVVENHSGKPTSGYAHNAGTVGHPGTVGIALTGRPRFAGGCSQESNGYRNQVSDRNPFTGRFGSWVLWVSLVLGVLALIAGTIQIVRSPGTFDGWTTAAVGIILLLQTFLSSRTRPNRAAGLDGSLIPPVE
jgi:hypothetical protein